MMNKSTIPFETDMPYTPQKFPEPNTVPSGWDVSAFYGQEYERQPKPERTYDRNDENIYDSLDDA